MTLPLIGEIKAEEIRIGYRSHYEQWHRELDKGREFQPENIRFEHNSNWRNEGFWSIQRAHDQSHWGWVIVSWLFAFGQASALIYFKLFSF